MLNTPADKYQPYPTLSLPDRRWPEQIITCAPRGSRPTYATVTRRWPSRWTARASCNSGICC